MDYQVMLDRLEWDLRKGKNDLDKLDRIVSGFRMSVSKGISAKDSYEKSVSFWSEVAVHNPYMCALLVNRYQKRYGSEDQCVEAGREALKHALEPSAVESGVIWNLLAEAEINCNFHIIQYTRIAITENTLKTAVKLLELSADLSDTILFLLHVVVPNPDGLLRRGVFNRLNADNWKLEIADSANRYMIRDIVNSLINSNDISSLISMLDLFEDLKVSDLSEKGLDGWKEYLLLQSQPGSAVFFRKLLKREGMGDSEILEGLYCFTAWATNDDRYRINDYLYLSYGVRMFPERYEEFSALFSQSNEMLQKVADENGTSENDRLDEEDTSSLGTVLNRNFNNSIVEKPFVSLIEKKPEVVRDFIDLIGPISLYHESRSLQYRKREAFRASKGQYLNAYLHYLDYAVKNYSHSDVLHIYMNSPIKGMVDLSRVLRMLYMPETGFVDLTKELDHYIFCGRIRKAADSDEKTAYRVSISNVCTSYLFPIHHTWAVTHLPALNEFAADDLAYFKIMSMNSKGMIFVYDISKKPKDELHKEKPTTKSVVIKRLDQVTDGTLPLQGKNTEEKARLYVIAFVFDKDGRLLVDPRNEDGTITNYIPFLPVSNMEDSGTAVKRLLNYNLGFEGNLSVQPCGIRHLCKDYNIRSVFYIYRFNYADLRMSHGVLIHKGSLRWVDFNHFREAITDVITESFASAMDVPWSEYVIPVSSR